jgi:hypothetical protein
MIDACAAKRSQLLLGKVQAAEMSEAAIKLIEGLPGLCARCEAPLCVRKQVLNLALGNTDELLCLKCLAIDNENTQEGVLTGLGEYIQTRDCFRKEWVKYRGVEDCPDRKGCIPAVCFAGVT